MFRHAADRGPFGPLDARSGLHRPELQPPLARGEEKIAALMARQTARFAAGTTFVEAGTAHGLTYRLREGWAGRVRALPDGRSQVILVFLPGDVFALKSMFFTAQPDSIQALSDVVADQAGERELRELFCQDADVALRCTWQVLEEERRLHNWVVGLGRGGADERLALMLWDFRERLALAGTIGRDALEFDLPMTQEQMGDHLGLSTVHVNRVLRSMREAKVASMRAGRVTIGDPERLAELARPLLDERGAG